MIGFHTLGDHVTDVMILPLGTLDLEPSVVIESRFELSASAFDLIVTWERVEDARGYQGAGSKGVITIYTHKAIDDGVLAVLLDKLMTNMPHTNVDEVPSRQLCHELFASELNSDHGSYDKGCERPTLLDLVWAIAWETAAKTLGEEAQARLCEEARA